jgi:hypothetical protein
MMTYSPQHGYEDLMAPLVAQACIAVLPKDVKNFNVDNVRCVSVCCVLAWTFCGALASAVLNSADSVWCVSVCCVRVSADRWNCHVEESLL